jgi:hypothetical protein
MQLKETRVLVAFGMSVLVLASLNFYFWKVGQYPTVADAWLYVLIVVCYFALAPVILRSTLPFKFKRAVSTALLISTAASALADHLAGFANLISCIALLSCAGYLLSRVNSSASTIS